MKALVVYDSVFGNTEKIAQVIGSTLGLQGKVDTIQVGQMTEEELSGLDILVVGSPTRGFRPTEAMTKFLKSLVKNQLNGIHVAVFDTRILLDTINSRFFRFLVNKGGYAASIIAKELKNKGGKLILPPEGFLVLGSEGPLKEGELERAADWAKRITN